MKSYPSYIDGHAISCEPFPTERKEFPTRANFLALCKRPVHGTKNDHADLYQRRNCIVLKVTGKVELEKSFYLNSTKFEWYDGKTSLIDFLIDLNKKFPDGLKISLC